MNAPHHLLMTWALHHPSTQRHVRYDSQNLLGTHRAKRVNVRAGWYFILPTHLTTFLLVLAHIVSKLELEHRPLHLHTRNGLSNPRRAGYPHRPKHSCSASPWTATQTLPCPPISRPPWTKGIAAIGDPGVPCLRYPRDHGHQRWQQSGSHLQLGRYYPRRICRLATPCMDY